MTYPYMEIKNPDGTTSLIPLGVNGLSAYDVAVKNGFGGTEAEWLESLKGGSASIDVTASVGQTIIVKEVDENGKPTKWERAEYQPRTHWQGEKVMIAEHTFEAGFVGKNIIAHSDGPPMGLTVGKTYIVVFDGVTYTCVAEAGVASLDGVNMHNVISIGNLVAVGGVDNGRPFILGDIPGLALWACIPDVYGTHTLSVTGVDETNTIPVKYLSEGFPYIVKVTEKIVDNVVTYSCAETVAQLEEIFNSGREIKVITQNDASVGPNYYYNILIVTQDVYGYVMGFTRNGDYSNSGNLYIFLKPQEDGTYAVTNDFAFGE